MVGGCGGLGLTALTHQAPLATHTPPGHSGLCARAGTAKPNDPP